MFRAFAAVEEEADRRGVTIAGSEIVGLVPAAALQGTSPENLKLVGGDWVLEDRLKRLQGR
jgi:glutamate formiminotransferase